jgi:hypothetical protein
MFHHPLLGQVCNATNFFLLRRIRMLWQVTRPSASPCRSLLVLPPRPRKKWVCPQCSGCNPSNQVKSFKNINKSIHVCASWMELLVCFKKFLGKGNPFLVCKGQTSRLIQLACAANALMCTHSSFVVIRFVLRTSAFIRIVRAAPWRAALKPFV